MSERIGTTTALDAASHPKDYYLLTYAETGFAPLSYFADAWGIEKPRQEAFAEAVNSQSILGTLFPDAPISALPKHLVFGEELENQASVEQLLERFFYEQLPRHAPRRVLIELGGKDTPVFIRDALRRLVTPSVAPGVEILLSVF